MYAWKRCSALLMELWWHVWDVIQSMYGAKQKNLYIKKGDIVVFDCPQIAGRRHTNNTSQGGRRNKPSHTAELSHTVAVHTGDGRRDWTDRHSAVTKLDVKGIFDTEVDHRISDSPWYKPDFDSHACRDELCGQKASGTSSAVVPSSGLITMVEIGISSTIEVWTVESDATNEVCA